MSEVNAHISVTNLPQFDRVQSDSHRTPIVSQQQNAEMAQEQLLRRTHMPVQPDSVEGKKVDPEEKRQERLKAKKKKRSDNKSDGERRRPKNFDQGRFLDVEA